MTAIDKDRTGYFDAAFAPLTRPATDRLAAELALVARLRPAERDCLVDAVVNGLRDVLGRLVSRVLILELNAARVGGTLRAQDPAARWDEFVARCAEPGYWDGLRAHYPTLLDRLGRVIDNRCAATGLLGRRFARDRDLLGPDAELTELSLGHGDSHRGGQTVSLIRYGEISAVYKPRSLRVDAVLAEILDRLREVVPSLAIRVPAVRDRGEYGWAEFVAHRFCADEAELRAFYRGCGHWLALTRLLGGGDLHGENLIACGPVPVVVDCETIIAPAAPPRVSGHGDAVDRAHALVADSVLRVGLLPSRGTGLGWRGVDMSAVGGLTDEQPQVLLPIIVDGGKDTARLGYRLADRPLGKNHPTGKPALARMWGEVLDGFDELTGELVALDRAGRLEPMLDGLRDCRIRVVLRDTEAYSEHARMLWHPVSLHEEADAVAQTANLLRQQSENIPGTPGQPEVIAAEIGELLDGDIPIFTTTPRTGVLAGPRGVTLGGERDLLDEALARWRGLDPAVEDTLIRASLVSAYLNDGWLPTTEKLPEVAPQSTNLDERRRRLAAGLLDQLRDAAIRGDDDTATWIAPVLDASGWQVHTATPEVYTGLPGIAILLAGYAGEVRAGRADPVSGLDGLSSAVLRGMRLAEDQWWRDQRRSLPQRPAPPGGYVGLGSRVWAWLLLAALGVAGDGVDRAVRLAAKLPDAVAEDTQFDVLTGMAGAIVPLLHLAEATRDGGWTQLATEIGARLAEHAVQAEGTARWPTERWPVGLGGFAHGATGIGWALERLAVATGRPNPLAGAAFAYEQTLYSAKRNGWLDARESEPFTATAWCHGAGGIGIAAADLLSRTGRQCHRTRLGRAAKAVWPAGMSWNHTLCHGDLGAWELLRAALHHGVGPADLYQSTLDETVTTNLEHNGAVSGLARDAYSPGLLPGLGGVAYQLLRLHDECPLPSVLLLDLP